MSCDFSSESEDFSRYINKDLKGTRTEKCLIDAFSGESQARNRYTYFAQQAKKEGYVQISRIFEETAENEKEHGKIWFKLLSGGNIQNTLENLKSAANAENYEWEDMYAGFANVAREEGFKDIACLFETIRNIEKMHESRYRKLIENINTDSVFKKERKVMWECAKCGYSFEVENAPEICPFCKHPKAYFFEKCYNY